MTRFHGPNVVICEIVSSGQRTSLIGVYLPPSTRDHLPDLEESFGRFPGKGSIVIGDLNVDIGCLQNQRSQQAAYVLASFGLVDLLSHFRQRLRFRHMKTWWQV